MPQESESKTIESAIERKSGRASEEVKTAKTKRLQAVTRKSLKPGEKPDPNAVSQAVNDTVYQELNMAAMLCYRVRYFTAGAVIGSKAFVNEAFAAARERFSDKRKDGARRMRGHAAVAGNALWSMRNLRVDVV